MGDADGAASMTPFVAAWARAFFVTVAIELAIAPWLLDRQPWTRRAGAVVLANLASHPIVWLVIPELGLGWPLWLIVAELWAVVVEATLYVLVFRGRRQAVLASLVANAASLAVGLVLRRAGLPV